MKEEEKMDYEKIEIYPNDYDKKTRKKLYHLLRTLGIRFEYEHY